MPQIIDVPGHGQVEFPDGMSDADITAAIQKNMPQVSAAPPVSDSDVMARIHARKQIADIPDLLNKGAYALGGRVTDFGANLGLPPEAAAGLGFAANVGAQAVAPVAIGKAVGQLAAPAMEGAGRFLMRSALNAPLKARMSGDAERAVNTLLEKGYNPTVGGGEAMGEAASGLGQKVTGITDQSQYAMDPNSLYPYVRQKLQKAVTPGDIASDTGAIRNVWDEFVNSVPNPMPVKQAQELKEAIYQSIGDKSYGIRLADESAKVGAQKALARGLKDKIAQLEPDTAPLLAQQSDLLNAAQLAQRRGATDQGLKVLGLAPAASSPARFLAFLLDKYTLGKSLTARGLYSGAERIPEAASGGTAALAQALLNKQGQQ